MTVALWILAGIPIGGIIVAVIAYALGRPLELTLVRGRHDSGSEVLFCVDVDRGTARVLDLRWTVSDGGCRMMGVHGLPRGASAELRERAKRILWDMSKPPSGPLRVVRRDVDKGELLSARDLVVERGATRLYPETHDEERRAEVAAEMLEERARKKPEDA